MNDATRAKMERVMRISERNVDLKRQIAEGEADIAKILEGEKLKKGGYKRRQYGRKPVQVVEDWMRNRANISFKTLQVQTGLKACGFDMPDGTLCNSLRALHNDGKIEKVAYGTWKYAINVVK